MLSALAETLGPWLWIIFGLILLALEIVLPGTILLWFGLSAIVVGPLSFIAFGWSWQVEVVIFLVLSIVFVIIGRRWLKARIASDEGDATLNRRAERYHGRTVVLSEAISSGHGRARIDDTVWRVRGPDCPAGSEVQVVDSDGPVLVVEPKEDG